MRVITIGWIDREGRFRTYKSEREGRIDIDIGVNSSGELYIDDWYLPGKVPMGVSLHNISTSPKEILSLRLHYTPFGAPVKGVDFLAIYNRYDNSSKYSYKGDIVRILEERYGELGYYIGLLVEPFYETISKLKFGSGLFSKYFDEDSMVKVYGAFEISPGSDLEKILEEKLRNPNEKITLKSSGGLLGILYSDPGRLLRLRSLKMWRFLREPAIVLERGECVLVGIGRKERVPTAICYSSLDLDIAKCYSYQIQKLIESRRF